jgi:hypothetical protein
MASFYAKYVGTGGGGSGGTGDVIGPASSDDNGLVLFDGISGKEIKQATGTGVVSVVSGVASINAITASRAVVSNASGIPIAATTTATEIGYVNGVTSSIQTQLNSKQGTITPGSISTSTTGVTVGSGANSTIGPNVTINVDTATNLIPGLLSATTQSIGGDKNFKGTSTFDNYLILNNSITYTPTVNNTLTGSNADIASHSTDNFIFTNSGLVSIGSINNQVIAAGHELKFTNNTGNAITLVNNYGSPPGTSAVILTGYGGNVLIPNNGSAILLYNTNGSNAWNLTSVILSAASASNLGPLSATDWTTFNSKQAGDATLTALAAYNTNGLMTQTAADTFTGRTITGTANRLSVSNGDGVSGNPTLNIDTAYVGQNTITTLGTITTGTWTGTTIAIANGGTGETTAANAMNALLAPTPTAMTDAVSTSLGLKQYVAGTNYNSGISPTLSGTNWTTTRGVFVPYQTQDGTWRLTFNFRGTRTTGSSIGSYTVTVNGVTFKNTSNFLQAFVFGATNLAADSNVGFGYANPNAATLTMAFSSNDPSSFFGSGDVELDSKPTWAY